MSEVQQARLDALKNEAQRLNGGEAVLSYSSHPGRQHRYQFQGEASVVHGIEAAIAYLTAWIANRQPSDGE